VILTMQNNRPSILYKIAAEAALGKAYKRTHNSAPWLKSCCTVSWDTTAPPISSSISHSSSDASSHSTDNDEQQRPRRTWFNGVQQQFFDLVRRIKVADIEFAQARAMRERLEHTRGQLLFALLGQLGHRALVRQNQGSTKRSLDSGNGTTMVCTFEEKRMAKFMPSSARARASGKHKSGTRTTRKVVKKCRTKCIAEREQ